MQTFKSYVYKNGKHDFNRAYRETLIFQMINTFEKNYVPDGAVGLDDYRKSAMTIEQKRRLRNEIVRRSSDYVKTHPDESVYDTDVIVNAFFDTKYGQSYANQREDWENNDKQTCIDTVSGWTTGQPEDGILRFTVSPYDPAFAGSDLFDDNSDEIGYIVGVTKSGGKPGVAKSAISVTGEFGVDPSDRTDAVIRGVHLGHDGLVLQYDDSIASDIKNTRVSALYNKASMSGYNDIKHYIKTEENKRAVRDFLMSNISDENPLPSDQRKFMIETCKWLSESGMDFDIKVDENKGNKYLVADLGSRRDIRLLDLNEPQYQGRVFDNGLIAHVSLPIREDSTAKGAKEAHTLITADDKLNGVKWYFGENVSIINDSELSGYSNVPVGSANKIRFGKSGKSALYRAPRNTRTNAPVNTMYASGLSTGNAANVTVSLRQLEYTSGDRTYSSVLPINYRVSYMMSPYNTIIPAFNDSSFANNGEYVAKAISDVVPESKFYPDDIVPVTENVLDENGIETGETVTRNGLRTDIPYDHRDYYRHAYVREKLSSWVDSAKQAHAEAVNIDDIVDNFKQYYGAAGNGYEYQFSGDEKIAEIQKLYWDVLAGVKETGKTKNHGTAEDDEIPTFDESVFKASLDEKVTAIKEHYSNYVENAFGRVPELPLPFASDEENAEIAERNKTAGFDPTIVARYVNTPDSSSVQRNHDYIRNMLMRLDDAYTPDFIKDGTYIAKEIKNDMIKYDPSTAVYKGSSENRGILIAQVIDSDSRTVDYDTLYELAPDLRDKPVTTEMLVHTAEVLSKSGCEWTSIEVNVDDNGIISYRGAQMANKKGYLADSKNNYIRDIAYDPSAEYPSRSHVGRQQEYVMVNGTIGQIFEPDENGVIIPHYASEAANKVIIPGYDAYLVDNDPDDPKPMSDRLRLSDWKHQMKQAISAEIHRATFGNSSQYKFVPHTTSLNNVYRHTYDTEMTVEEYRDKLDPSKSSEEEVATFRACLDTLRNRCRFPNEYGEGSTTMAQSMLEHPAQAEAKAFDYYYSDLCDNHNLRVLDESFDGIFDKDMTGTAKTQGLVRYLVDGVEIDSNTGEVTPVEVDPNDPPKCALMADPMMATTMHNTWDRTLMSSTQVLSSLRTPRHVGVGMFNLMGDTFDDGFTVSKAFAEKYAIKGSDGEMRPLMPQDKLADKNGNKGVITRVVDPDQLSSRMINEVEVTDITDYDHSVAEYRGETYKFKYNPVAKDSETGEEISLEMQATKAIQKQLGIHDEIVQVFADNPNLDVVASPYSGMSRFNGGTIRELMTNPDNLKLNGENIEGGMGYMDMIVVDMPADVKTHWYDDDAIREGKGRKASGQLLWAFGAMGADKVIDEIYGSNNKAWDNFREYAIVTGLDLTEDMTPVVGYHQQTGRGEHRKLFTLPEQDERFEKISIKSTGELDKKTLRTLHDESGFVEEINKSGGFMEVPFQLDFGTAGYMKQKNSKIKDEWFMLQETGNTRQSFDGEEVPTYGVPILPPSLRSGQDFKDGTSRNHDYTKWYIDIHNCAIDYMIIESKMAELKDGKDTLSSDEYDKKMQDLQSKRDSAKSSAQESFNKIVSDVVDKQFNTKYNVIRDECMVAKVPSSATAVISAGIDLKSDEVAMSAEHAVQLGIMGYDQDKDEYYWSNRITDRDGNVTNPGNGRALLWRDPILRTGNVRYMNVVIDNSVLGVKINPAMDYSFDGDFDGDSYAVIALKTDAAQKQAFTKFHVSNNLLNLGVKDPETGKYPLFINSGMDMAAIMYEDKSGKLQKTYNEIEDAANRMQAAIEAGDEGIAAFTYECPKLKRRTNKSGMMRIVKDEDGNPVYETNPDGSYVMTTLTGETAIKTCKRDCKNKLDEFVIDAFKDIGTDHIVVKSPETVVASCQHIVDSGAKGNQGKMQSLMDNIGIEYELGEDGRAIPESAKNITHEIDSFDENGNAIKKSVPCPKLIRDGELAGKDLAREENKRIQETTAYKADNTALGGTSSQNGVSAFRDKCLFEILELTYPTTQAILQSKHDPDDAKAKDAIVRFWGHDVWDGYRLTGDWTKDDPAEIQAQAHTRILKTACDPKGNPIRAQERIVDQATGKATYRDKTDRDGNPVYETYYEKCTKSEWISQMKGMFKALKVDVNEDYINTLADNMTRETDVPMVKSSDGVTPIRYYDGSSQILKGDAGRVMGVTTFANENGALLDKIAYSGRMTALTNAALSNYEPYQNEMAMVGADIKESGSILGSATSKSVDVYDYTVKARTASSKDDAKAYREKANAIKEQINPSGMFAPKSIAAELSGDRYRKNENCDMNRVYRKGEYRDVAPKPVGRKDCLLSKADFDKGVRSMGETTMEYKARVNSFAIELDNGQQIEVPVATPEVVPEVTTETANPQVNNSSPRIKISNHMTVTEEPVQNVVESADDVPKQGNTVSSDTINASITEISNNIEQSGDSASNKKKYDGLG